jgi:hypothetical protein
VNLANLENVVKGYGQRVLLDGVSAGVAAGERVGVVGRPLRADGGGLTSAERRNLSACVARYPRYKGSTSTRSRRVEVQGLRLPPDLGKRGRLTT